jgi:serine/threonine-protein kinase
VDGRVSGGIDLGRYALYDEIARGGMASVHLGRLLGPARFFRLVAIKRLHAHFARDPEFVTMMMDEARVAARIRHPNVVPTLDVVLNTDELLLVMEYVHGESLARLAAIAADAGRPIPIKVAVSVVCDTLRGLHAAHEAKDEAGRPLDVVHRDVSPQNVLVGTDGISRVIDFGIAKAMGRLQTTRDGQIKGKLAYMAPERLSNRPVTRAVDLYAAAVVLWELVTGVRLFKGETEGALVTKILNATIQSPASLNPDVPRELDDAIMKGLAREPEDRYETALTMEQALLATVGGARPDEVAAWVQSLVGDTLRVRGDRIAQIESGVTASPSAAAKPGDRESSPSATGSSGTSPGRRSSGARIATPLPAALPIGPVLPPPRNPTSSMRRVPNERALEPPPTLDASQVPSPPTVDASELPSPPTVDGSQASPPTVDAREIPTPPTIDASRGEDAARVTELPVAPPTERASASSAAPATPHVDTPHVDTPPTRFDGDGDLTIAEPVSHGEHGDVALTPVDGTPSYLDEMHVAPAVVGAPAAYVVHPERTRESARHAQHEPTRESSRAELQAGARPSRSPFDGSAPPLRDDTPSLPFADTLAVPSFAAEMASRIGVRAPGGETEPESAVPSTTPDAKRPARSIPRAASWTAAGGLVLAGLFAARALMIGAPPVTLAPGEDPSALPAGSSDALATEVGVGSARAAAEFATERPAEVEMTALRSAEAEDPERPAGGGESPSDTPRAADDPVPAAVPAALPLEGKPPARTEPPRVGTKRRSSGTHVSSRKVPCPKGTTDPAAGPTPHEPCYR